MDFSPYAFGPEYALDGLGDYRTRQEIACSAFNLSDSRNTKLRDFLLKSMHHTNKTQRNSIGVP